MITVPYQCNRYITLSHDAWQQALPELHGSSTSRTRDQEEPEWDMLKEFTKKQFSGLAGEYTSSKDKRDALRKAIMVSYATYT